MSALETLREWLDRRAKAIESAGVKIAVEWGPGDRRPQSATLDFEARDRTARLIIWENGEADLMIGDLATNEILLEEHREITTEIGLDDVKATVLSWL